MSSVPTKKTPKVQLDKKRLQEMFVYGAAEGELTECLKKKRLMLISAKVRANAPPDHKGKAKFIAGMSDEALKHIKDWFRANGNFTSLPPAAEACDRLAAQEFSGASAVSKKEVSALWRSVLQAFTDDTRNQIVESFLSQKPLVENETVKAKTFAAKKNRLKEALPKKPAESESTAPASDLSVITLTDLDANHAVLITSAEGGLPELERPEVALIVGFVSAARGDVVSYYSAKQALLESSLGARFVSILDSLCEQSKKYEQIHISNNVRPALHLTDVDSGDRDQMMIIGTRERVLENGIFFLRVLGVLVDGQVVEMSALEAREIFLENGDAIGFPNVAGQAPQDQALGVWHVRHMDTDKSARYSVSRFERRVYNIVELPHSKNEPDKVRIWIQHSYKPHQDIYPLFRLSDGIIIRPSRDVPDPVNFDFDVSMNAYKDLPIFVFHKQPVFAGVFPAPDFKFDCAPAQVLIKRLFKAKSKLASLPQITKVQLNDLAILAMEEATDEVLRNSLERAKGKVEALVSANSDLDDVISDLLELPPVQARIEEEIQRGEGELNDRLTKSKIEIEKLQKEKSQLQSDIKNLKGKIEREAKGLALEVRKAFDSASADGVKTLAQVAVISRALGLSTGNVVPQMLEVIPSSELIATKCFMPNGTRIGTIKQLDAAIMHWAHATGTSSTLMRAAIAASTHGVIALAGQQKEELYEFLVHTLSGGVACDLSISGDMFSLSDVLNAAAVIRDEKQTKAMLLGEFLSNLGDHSGVCTVRLRGANRMPPESLLPELFDACCYPPAARRLAWIDKSGATRLLAFSAPIVFVLDFVQGRSVFPCYPPTSFDLPVVDTSLPWDDLADVIPDFARPCGFLDAGYYFGTLVASGKGRVPPELEILSRESLVVSRMYEAAKLVGMSEGDAGAFVVAALGVGRLLRKSLPLLPAISSQAWQKYFDDADLSFGQSIFEKGSAK